MWSIHVDTLPPLGLIDESRVAYPHILQRHAIEVLSCKQDDARISALVCHAHHRMMYAALWPIVGWHYAPRSFYRDILQI